MSGQQQLSEQLIFVNSTCSTPDAHIKQLLISNTRAVRESGLSKRPKRSNKASPQTQMQEAQAAPLSSRQAAYPAGIRFSFCMWHQQKGMVNTKAP